MKRLILAALIATLAGCSTTGQFQNRVVFTAGCDRAFLASMYGQFGITSEIASADVLAVCKKGGVNAPQ